MSTNEQGRGPVAQGASAAVGVVVVAVLGLAALVVSPNATQTTSPGAGAVGSVSAQSGTLPAEAAPTGEVTSVTVTVDGMRFNPSTIEVPQGNTLHVTFENTGDQRHDLVFENGAVIEPIPPGASAEVEVGPISADMDGWCTLPGHRQMGMELKVVATGGTASTQEAPGVSTQGHMQMPGHGAETSGSSIADNALNMTALLEEAANHDPFPAELPDLPAQNGPVTREFTFEVTEQEDDLAVGVVRPVWTFGGTSPGPVLHGRVGDEFVIHLVNNGTMGHSIDFHAGETAPDMAMRTIDPGETLEYRFTAGRSGIWMYHCSTMPMSLHIANGMFGAVVIEPDELPEVDKSYVLIQSEFYVDEAANTSAEKLANLVPDVAMFNGRAFQYDAHPLLAKVGDRVRFWVLDVGPNSPLAFHIVGTQFDTVWSEGHYDVYRGESTDGITKGTTGAQVLPLQAAQGGFVELIAPEQGHYPIVNHIMSLAEKGAHGILEVE